jgi:hypothetical protein
VLQDSNTTAGASLTSEKDLTIGQNLSLSATDTTQNGYPSPSPVLYLPGLTALQRWINPSSGDHWEATETGSAGTGYSFESSEGQLTAFTSAQPANTSVLYSCVLPGPEEMTTLSSTCGVPGVTATPLGYIWNSASVAPPGSAQLFRCLSGSEHFDSLSTSCEGGLVDSSLGWVAQFGQITTASQAIDTTQSFTVSAWVKPMAPSAQTHTIMSEAGPVNSGFSLQQNSAGMPAFCVESQTAAAAAVCATGNTKMEEGSWVLVTGIWDAVNKQVRVIIGGTAAPVAVMHRDAPAGDVSANGALTIGSAVSGGAVVNQWSGDIDDPTAFPGVASVDQIQDLHDGTSLSGSENASVLSELTRRGNGLL